MKIGLFGGTFNPFHMGHLKALKAFSAFLGDGKVIVMPTGTPPHKKFEREISDEYRLEMVNVAVGGMRNVYVSDYEIKNGEKSFTAETLKWLKNSLSQTDEIYLYTGSDMFMTIDKWRDPETIFSIANVVCLSRTGHDKEKLLEQKDRLEREYGARCRVIPFEPIEISSSDVRKMIREKDEDARLYLPESVYAFLTEKDLYSKPLPQAERPSSDYGEYMQLLSKRLNPHRYQHSLGVMETMEKLALKYGADVEKAKLAGLLHDITKNDSPEEQKALINKYNIPADEAQLRYGKLHHSLTAPYVLKYELGISDEEILSAVRYHTTGRANMTLLEKILYVADYVDPTRDYEDVEFYRKLAFSDIDRAAFLCLVYTMEDLSSQKSFIHKDTYDAYQYYVRYYEDNPDKVFDENTIRI